MAHSGKIVAHHRHGQGKISSHRLTALRIGARFGESYATERMADTFVDVAPHLSLKGLDINRLMDRRGDVMTTEDESHVHQRTRAGRQGRSRSIVAKGQFDNGR